jgi:hypothetical protein
LVGQWVHPLEDAQQLHEAAALAFAPGTAAQAGGRGVQLLVEVAPTLQRLDDRVDGALPDAGLLGGGAFSGLRDAVIDLDALRGRHGQRLAVVQQQLHPASCRGLDDFTLLQGVSGLEGTAMAIGIDRESGAGDGNHGGDLGHGLAPVNPYALRSGRK